MTNLPIYTPEDDQPVTIIGVYRNRECTQLVTRVGLKSWKDTLNVDGPCTLRIEPPGAGWMVCQDMDDEPRYEDEEASP
jgi:hypothetical protein